MEDGGGTASVSDHSFVIPNSKSEKRVSVAVEEKSELGHKRMKVQPFSAEGTNTNYPKSWTHKEVESTQEAMSNVTKETLATNSNFNESVGIEVGKSLLVADRAPLDLNAKIKSNINFVKPRHFVLDLNEQDVSSSINNDTFRPYKSTEHVNPRDVLECESSISPLNSKDPMKVWKEMKQNGFLSTSNGGIPAPKPRGRKSKNDGIKKKIELAKKEQVDRFAKIAAPSGLLNGLNPGIINHVRNSKQVHSIIEALVRSEKRENRQMRTKYGSKECSERKDQENVNDVGVNRIVARHGNDDSISHDKVVMKLSSSSTNMASEISSSLSNEDSRNLTGDSALSVKAANVAFQWLELLYQDIKGRLAALRRSKNRVRAVIKTELPFLMSREFFSYNQENDPYNVMRTCGSDNTAADVHRARWNPLFDQMEKALCEEENQLESWLNQVKEMKLHCENGLFQFQQLSTLENGYIRVAKSDNPETDLAISAAAASVYSTCNFLQSMENIPCL